MRASVWALETFRGTIRLTAKGNGLFVCNLGRPNPHTLETGGFCFLESNFLHFFTRPKQTKKSGRELRWSRKIVSGCWWLIFGGRVPTFSFGMFSCTSLPPWQNLVLASSHSGVVFSGHTFAKHLQKTSLRMKSERSQHLMWFLVLNSCLKKVFEQFPCQHHGVQRPGGRLGRGPVAKSFVAHFFQAEKVTGWGDSHRPPVFITRRQRIRPSLGGSVGTLTCVWGMGRQIDSLRKRNHPRFAFLIRKCLGKF